MRWECVSLDMHTHAMGFYGFVIFSCTRPSTIIIKKEGMENRLVERIKGQNERMHRHIKCDMRIEISICMNKEGALPSPK